MEGTPGPRGGRVRARRRGRDPRQSAAARRAAGAAAARDGHLPRDADPARRRPGALDQAGRRRARRQPHAGDGRRARPRGRGAGPGRALRRRRRRRSSPACSRSPTGRCASSSRAPSGCGSAPTSPRSPTWSRGSPSCPTWSSEGPELEALTRNVQRTFSEIIEQIPYLPEELQMAVANIEDPAALGHLIAGALRIATEEKQELLEEVDVAARLRRLSADPRPRARGARARQQDPVAGPVEVDKGQREYFLRQQLKAIQEELGEGDEQQAEVDELRERIEAAELPEDARKAAERELARLERLPPASAEHGVIRTYLEWLVELPWSKRDRGQARPRPRPRGPRRRPLRPREGQGAHPRVPGRAQAEARHEGADPLLRRPARRRQDVARPARSPGRWAASSCASRSAACATRPRSAATAAPTSARCPAAIVQAMREAGYAQPGLHARRDRQARRRLPRRSRLGAARGARPGAELHASATTTSTSPFDLSKVHVHRHREHARPDSRPAARPHGDRSSSPATRARRSCRSPAATSSPSSSRPTGSTPAQIEFTDAALTAIIEEYTREAGVRNLEREIGTICRKVAARRRRGQGQGQA